MLADYDPFSEEQQERQQPSCIPLSSALRFYTNLPSRKPAGGGHTKVATTGAGHPTAPHHHGQQTAGGGSSGKAAPVTAAGLPSLGRASSTGSASPSGQWDCALGTGFLPLESAYLGTGDIPYTPKKCRYVVWFIPMDTYWELGDTLLLCRGTCWNIRKIVLAAH